MAKILQVSLHDIPDTITVGKTAEEITVHTRIEFHPLDMKLEMEYLLHIYIYDIIGKKDTIIFAPNWDHSQLTRMATDQREDDFLCKKTESLSKEKLPTGDNLEIEVISILTPQLGNLSANTSVYTRNFKVFTALTPAINTVFKWSAPFESQLIFGD